MAEEQKKRGKTGRRVTTAAAAAALLLLAGSGVRSGGWGLLPGEGNSLLPEKEQTQVTETVEAEAPEAADDGVLTVSVHESQISFEGKAVTPEELEEALLRAYSEGVHVELVDDGAIKADYDAAAAILDKLEIPYAVR